MSDCLSSFLIEIECPSGAKLVGNLEQVIQGIVATSLGTSSLLPAALVAPDNLEERLRARPGAILDCIFYAPWRILITHMHSEQPLEVSDVVAWADMLTRISEGNGEGPNPFLARVRPIETTPAADEPQEIFQDIKGIAQTALDRLRDGNTEGAVNLLASLVLACEGTQVPPMPGPSYDVLLTSLRDVETTLDRINNASRPGQDMDTASIARRQLRGIIDAVEKARANQPNPPLVTVRCFSGTHEDKHPSCILNSVTGDWSCLACGAKGNVKDAVEAGDGWGHAHEATTVEALLREGDAMLKGTDKHEQMFKGTDEEIQQTRLAKSIERTNERLKEQTKVLEQHTRVMSAHAEAIRLLQTNYGGMMGTLQKLYRYAKTEKIAVAYGGRPSPLRVPDFTNPQDPAYERDRVYRAMWQAAQVFGAGLGTFTASDFAAAFKDLSGSDTLLDIKGVRGVLKGRPDVITLRGGAHYQIIR